MFQQMKRAHWSFLNLFLWIGCNAKQMLYEWALSLFRRAFQKALHYSLHFWNAERAQEWFFYKSITIFRHCLIFYCFQNVGQEVISQSIDREPLSSFWQRFWNLNCSENVFL